MCIYTFPFKSVGACLHAFSQLHLYLHMYMEQKPKCKCRKISVIVCVYLHKVQLNFQAIIILPSCQGKCVLILSWNLALGETRLLFHAVSRNHSLVTLNNISCHSSIHLCQAPTLWTCLEWEYRTVTFLWDLTQDGTGSGGGRRC